MSDQEGTSVSSVPAMSSATAVSSEPVKLNTMIDHTILKSDATREQVEALCDEAIEYDFASVCVNSCWVPLCAEKLKDSSVHVCTVIGFPLGAASTVAKAAEATQAVADGADELDMVINVGKLLSGEADAVREDISAVVAAAQGRTVKVILETCLLSNDKIVEACELAHAAGADFVKTSTGFSSGGATVEDVALMFKTVGAYMKVKASGGIHTAQEALAMVEAGASRIGTSSGKEIMS